MSAGASTEPGGYSNFDERNWRPKTPQPGEQSMWLTSAALPR
jgi:hypothetical protein